MLKIVRLGLLYFTLVFGTGFLLGPIRVLLLEPRVGTGTAELLEMPVMLLVIWAAAGWILQRFAQNLSVKEQLSIGVLAVSGILIADVAVGVFLRGMSIVEVFLHRDAVSGAAYYGLLVLCALMLWLRGRQAEQTIS